MKREIKFRAWDGKYMITPDGCNERDFYILPNGEIKFSEDIGSYERVVEFFNHKSDFIVIQFTGIKDKNGKEIYEGDIIKTDYYSGTPGEFKRLIGVVVFHSAKFVVDGINKDEGLRKELHSCSEVIGNIYEHPNLLNA